MALAGVRSEANPWFAVERKGPIPLDPPLYISAPIGFVGDNGVQGVADMIESKIFSSVSRLNAADV